jgi:hypothetical protein
MTVYASLLERALPILAPTVCWECEQWTAEVFEARLSLRPASRSTVKLCRDCFQSCYVSLSVELLQELDGAEPQA